MRLEKDFFLQHPKVVAKKLLGKIIVRRINGEELKAKIVETEAYYGREDPASRARQNGDLRKTMEMDAGTILVYGVHNNWLVNFVTEEEGKASAVLIRAVEPLNFEEKCNGPGLLTKALKIDKTFHKKDVFGEEFFIIENEEGDFEIIESFRIGVKEDLDEKLRFYIKDNKFISKK